MSLDSPVRPPLVSEPVVYNVALGSNMDPAKMLWRKAGNGDCVTLLEEGVPCTVRDWAMTFDFLAMPPGEPVMSCGVPKEGAVLHGVLYKLSNADYQTLARTEGILVSGSGYKEREVEADVYPNAGTKLPKAPIRAILFGLRYPPNALPPYMYPSARYMKLLIAGARIAKLEPSVVESLETMPVARALSPRMRGFARFNIIGMFFMYGWSMAHPPARLLYWPNVLQLYSRREGKIAGGAKLGSLFWTCALVAFMLPVSFLGFCRALFQRRNVLRIARGEMG